MEIEKQIKGKLTVGCEPEYMELRNESHMHAGPAQDSHFNLIMVAALFSGLNAVKRHQLVYKLLEQELVGPVHALALHLFTPEEWNIESKVPGSPSCTGENA